MGVKTKEMELSRHETGLVVWPARDPGEQLQLEFQGSSKTEQEQNKRTLECGPLKWGNLKSGGPKHT